MRKPSNNEVRNSIIGLGDKSIKKNYYPQLKNKIKEIKELNKTLEEKVRLRTKELLEQKNIFETLFVDTADALVLIKDGKYIECNNALLKMLMCKDKKEFLSLQPHQISPEYQPDGTRSDVKTERLITQCIKHGQLEFDWVYTKKNGAHFWANMLMTNIIINDEVVIHAVWRDITDKKNLEQEVQQRNDELQKTNNNLQKTIINLEKTQHQLVESEKMASLGGLVAGISHEINTPIGVGVTGVSHLLNITQHIKNDYENNCMTQESFKIFLDSAIEASNLISANLDRVADLVNSFKKISVDQTSEEKREFNIKEYFHEILLSVSHILKKHNFTVEVNCTDGLLINSYPGSFSQIITNLIINSINHGYDDKKEGCITLEATEQAGYYSVIYKDDGKGIPKDNIERIFDPFFTTSRGSGGTGLGLYVVYNIVTTNLNGSIDCISEDNHGVEFHIVIPKNPPALLSEKL
ncbi:MAG: PAS domain-containing sensor histidine kinase [Gammaproteobacteria bacterium]|nr:PAS domain-containing sensor histidine kinase [Gammaproteobacteria bacterium]